MDAGVGKATFRFRCQQQVKDDVCGWTWDGSPAEALKFSSADATKPGVLPCPPADPDSELCICTSRTGTSSKRSSAPEAKRVSVVQMTQRLHFVKLMLPEIHSNNDKHLD